jgi:hypothetical protein
MRGNLAPGRADPTSSGWMTLTIVRPGSARSAATPPNGTIDAVSDARGGSARTTSTLPTSVTVMDRTVWSMSKSDAVARPLDRRDHQVIDDAGRGDPTDAGAAADSGAWRGRTRVAVIAGRGRVCRLRAAGRIFTEDPPSGG